MRYTVYQTTCLINGKVYVGVHQTEDPNDSYLGSGKLLRRAVKKHGRAAFIKEVLFDFDTREEMLAKERDLVTTAFKCDPSNYNLVEGGEASGFLFASADQQRRYSQLGNARQREMGSEYWGRKRAAIRKGVLAGIAGGTFSPPTFAGLEHSEETKAKMSGPRPASVGPRNSQFGTAWICKPGETPRKVPKTDLPAHLEEGWQRGRKPKGGPRTPNG